MRHDVAPRKMEKETQARLFSRKKMGCGIRERLTFFFVKIEATDLSSRLCSDL